jgi:hypothetical protein
MQFQQKKQKHIFVFHDIENQPIHDLTDDQGVLMHQATIQALLFQVFGEETDNVYAHDITWWIPHCPEKASAKAFHTLPHVLDHLRTLGAMIVNPGTKPDAVDNCLKELVRRAAQTLTFAPEAYLKNTLFAFITRDKDFANAIRQSLGCGVNVALVYDGRANVSAGLTGLLAAQPHHILANWANVKTGNWHKGLPKRLVVFFVLKKVFVVLLMLKLMLTPKPKQQPKQQQQQPQRRRTPSPPGIVPKTQKAVAVSAAVPVELNVAKGEFKRHKHSVFVSGAALAAVKDDSVLKAQCKMNGIEFFAYAQRADKFRVLMTCEDLAADAVVDVDALKAQLQKTPFGFFAHSLQRTQLPARKSRPAKPAFILMVDKTCANAEPQVQHLLAFAGPFVHGVGKVTFTPVVFGAKTPAEVVCLKRGEAGAGVVVNFYPARPDVNMDHPVIHSAIQRKIKTQLRAQHAK